MNGTWDTGLGVHLPVSPGYGGSQFRLFVWLNCRRIGDELMCTWHVDFRAGKACAGVRMPTPLLRTFSGAERARDECVAWVMAQVMRGEFLPAGEDA